MNKNLLDSKDVSDFASVLATGTAKARQAMSNISLSNCDVCYLRTHIWLLVAYPFASVRVRIGRHIVSLATLIKLYQTIINESTSGITATKKDQVDRTNPYTISSKLSFFSKFSLTVFASLPNAVREASKSRGSFSDLPNIFGKKSGIRRPRSRLASVTANGPPLLIESQ